MSLPKMLREVRDLKRDVSKLKLVRAPGALTNFTTQGVSVSPIGFQSGNSSTNTTNTTPRWA